MKLATCAYSYRDLLTTGQMTLEQLLDIARELNFDGVELTAYYFPDLSASTLHRIKREAFDRGLDVSGTAVGGNFSQEDEEKRRAQIEHVKTWLEHSSRLGSSVLRVFAGGVVEGKDRASCEGWVTDGLSECAAVAKKEGVILALENHGGLTSDAAGVLSLLAPFKDDPWVGLNLDFGNFTGDVYGQFRSCAPHAVTTHCKVTCRQGEGRSILDYREIVRIMESARYNGYLSIEYEEKEDPVVGVSRFAAYLRGCIVDA